MPLNHLLTYWDANFITHTQITRAIVIWDMQTMVGHRQIQRTRRGKWLFLVCLFFKQRGWLKGAIITDRGLNKYTSSLRKRQEGKMGKLRKFFLPTKRWKISVWVGVIRSFLLTCPAASQFLMNLHTEESQIREWHILLDYCMIHVLAREPQGPFSPWIIVLHWGKEGPVLGVKHSLGCWVVKLSNDAYMLVLTVSKMPINNTNQGCSWLRAIQLEHNGCCSWECGGESCYWFKQFWENGRKICMGIWEWLFAANYLDVFLKTLMKNRTTAFHWSPGLTFEEHVYVLSCLWLELPYFINGIQNITLLVPR